MFGRAIWAFVVALVSGNMEFYRAVEEGDAKTAAERVRSGADVNYKDSFNGLTALMAATLNKQSTMVRYLLAGGADVDLKDDTAGNTAMHWAILKECPNILRMLLDSDKPLENILNKDGNNLLHLAGAKDDLLSTEMTKEILKKGVPNDMINSFDKSGYTPLMRALMRGNRESAKAMINAGADHSLTGIPAWPPLRFACLRPGFADVVDLLVKKGANVNGTGANGASILMVTAEAGSAETIAYLMAAGADIRAKGATGYTLLHWFAMRKDCTEFIDTLLKGNLDINARTETGNTPLHCALKTGNKMAAWKLIENGADATIPNEILEFPHHLASAKNGMGDVLSELLSGKMDVDAKTTDSYTALNMAARSGNVDNAKILISKGAGLNNDDGRGFACTPLMSAVLCYNDTCAEQMITLLIDAGARIGKATATATFMKTLPDKIPSRLKTFLRAYPEDHFYTDLLNDIAGSVNRSSSNTYATKLFQKYYAKILGYLLTNGAAIKERAKDALSVFSCMTSRMVKFNNVRNENYDEFAKKTIRLHIFLSKRYVPSDASDFTRMCLKTDAVALHRILAKYYAEEGGKNLISLREYEASLGTRALQLYDRVSMRMIEGTYLEKVPLGVLYDIFDNIGTTFVRVPRKLNKLAWTLALVEKIRDESGRDVAEHFRLDDVVEKCFPARKKEVIIRNST